MGTIKEGARQAVRNCLKIKPKEKVVIIADAATLNVALVIEKEIKKIAKAKNVYFFIMEDFGKRPLSLPLEIRQALEMANVSLYIAQSGPPEERVNFRKPMLSIVKEKGLRHAHMISITPEIMKMGMCVDYSKVQRVCGLVFDKVKDIIEIRITSKKGTWLIASFLDPKIKWGNHDGNIQPGEWMNLPAGEVFTCPSHICGRIVIDGCLGDYFDEKYGSMEDKPATITIVNSRVKGIYCEDSEELERDLRSYFHRLGKNSTRVGEFAIGCNIGITKFIGNMLQDEKYPGIHIAFGSPFPELTGANWDSKAHLDAVIQKPTIIVDGETIMNTGKFLLQY